MDVYSIEIEVNGEKREQLVQAASLGDAQEHVLNVYPGCSILKSGKVAKVPTPPAQSVNDDDEDDED